MRTLEAFTVAHATVSSRSLYSHVSHGKANIPLVFKEMADLHIYVIFSMSIVILSMIIQWARRINF